MKPKDSSPVLLSFNGNTQSKIWGDTFLKDINSGHEKGRRA
jgi:hypothetical protein